MYTTTKKKSARKLGSIDRIRQNVQGLMVRNAGEEDAILDFGTQHGGSLRLCFPPGDTEVKDVYGVAREAVIAARKSRVDMRDLPQDVLVASAVDIVSHAEKRLGNRGITALSGDPDGDAETTEQAKAAWISHRVKRAENADKNYRKRTAVFAQDARNAGSVAPPKSEWEIKEQMWLDRYRAGMIGEKRLVCKYKCGFHHDDSEVMRIHLAASHPAAAEEARTEARLAEAPEVDVTDIVSDPVPAKNKGGRPRKVQAEA